MKNKETLLQQYVITFIVLLMALLLSSIPSFAVNKISFYTDAAGTPVAMSDENGDVVWRADYMPFGEEHEVAGSVKNKNRFIGKEKDEETDLYYFGARYLDARTGRFIKPDPVGIREADLLNPQRLNRYSYSLNNPYRYVDPDGREVVLRPEAMQTFHETREQVLGWAPSWLKDVIMSPDPVIGPGVIKTTGSIQRFMIGNNLKNIRLIKTGRLKGFTRFNTKLQGNEKGARDLFKKLTGREPAKDFDRAILEDKREVVFRSTEKSGSGNPKIEIINKKRKLLEKISFNE